MSKTMKCLMLGATVAAIAIAHYSFAQDDLDNLLKDLEAETSAKKTEKPAEPVAAAETKVEETKVEEKAEEKPAATEAAKSEEAKPAAEPVAEEKPAEEKAEAKEEEKAEEVKAEEKPAEEEKAEEKPAEEKAEEKAEAKEEEKPAEEKSEEKEEAKAEEVKAEEKPAEEAKPAVAEAKPAEKPVAKPAVKSANPDAELIENVTTTERLRRRALDVQAKREMAEARKCMEESEFIEAVSHYHAADRLLNDSPATANLRKECQTGIAEGLYRAALKEDDLGRRDRAIKLLEKADALSHPKSHETLVEWMSEGDKRAEAVDASEIKHRKNDKDYKLSREQIRRHLKRGRQYLSLRDMKKALEEVEVVLVNDPYNQEAIRLRGAIQKKRQTILQQERKASRDGMIADVDEAWRPAYAVNAAQLNAQNAETTKVETGDDPERTLEQDIERRMKEMRLPTISFKPPATIMDAVEFFRSASKDYDRPDIPVEKRGFNFILKTPQPLKVTAAAEAESDDFSSNASGEGEAAPSNGLDPIPTITASDITFYEALKLVCDSVDYKFIVRGPVVMIMHKDMSTAELLSRKYDVLDAFLERMTAASSDVKEMKSQGFGGGAKKQEEGEENQERDWKEFFAQMGVKWPEGSSIMYIKTLGKLYVRNTRENLAEFEKVLQEMGSQPKLIEIETRFVEVSQEDLNSLGFEWILNSDYSIGVGSKVAKALGFHDGAYGSNSGSTSANTSTTTGSSYNHNTTTGSNGSTVKAADYGSTTTDTGSSLTSYNTSKTVYDPNTTSGSRWIQNSGGKNLGINAFGGTSSQQNGNRYLSTVGNHISGESASNNDQFMRFNAFLGEADLSMILHMLSQRSDTDLLSAPKVVTKSGENAVIKVVTEYIYPQDYDVQLQSSSSGSSGGSSGGGQSAILAVVEPQNFTMREVGVILDVTPTYSEANGGTIDLELKPQVVDEPVWHNYGMRIPFTGNTSSGTMADIGSIFEGMATALTTIGAALTDADKEQMAKQIVNSAMDSAANVSSSSSANMTWYDAPMEQPWFHVRSIDSKVSITPGATVVMGGLITEARKAMDDKIPFLGDLPYIGRLFRSHAEQTSKRNLLIFVTGRLITPAGRELRVNDESQETEGEVKAAPKAE